MYAWGEGEGGRGGGAEPSSVAKRIVGSVAVGAGAGVGADILVGCFEVIGKVGCFWELL